MDFDLQNDTLSPVPRRLEHPYDNVPVLDWWKYDYDHVFVVLNPFYRVPGYTPETASFGPLRVSMDPETLMEQIEEGGMPEPLNPAPEGFEDLIKQTGEAVAWSDVAFAIGATDFDRFARTVWLQAIGGEIPEADQDLAARLAEYCERTGLYHPEEDLLPAAMEPVLGRYLAALGQTDVMLWSEWRDVSRLAPLDTFARENPASGLPGEKLSAVAAPGLLLSWGYDDIAGLLALTDAQRARANPADYFEGYWAGAETTSLVFAPEGAPPPSRRN